MAVPWVGALATHENTVYVDVKPYIPTRTITSMSQSPTATICIGTVNAVQCQNRAVHLVLDS